ncbi:hypothetical protein OF83DRAFT_1019024, partial [Amylostereum chailletii]
PVCEPCMTSLQDDKPTPPRYSLANDTWLGDVPFCLRALTLVEHLLIGHVFPRVFVVKLHPKDRRGGHDPSTLQSGLKGNVTTFEMNMDKISDMVHGSLMPQRPLILSFLITIAYIGKGPLPKEWLRGAFKVRRQHVADALAWLKENNRYYSDIDINPTRLAALPEDDIPWEL